MYADLSAAAAVERIHDHVHVAKASRRSALAMAAAAARRVRVPRRTDRVPLPRTACECHPAGA